MLIGVCDPSPAEPPKDVSSLPVVEETQPEDFGVPDLPTVVNRRPKKLSIRGRDIWARTKSATFDGIYVLMSPNLLNREKRSSLSPPIKEEKKR